jgi:hypothetical protein
VSAARVGIDIRGRTGFGARAKNDDTRMEVCAQQSNWTEKVAVRHERIRVDGAGDAPFSDQLRLRRQL